jgi:hypothetical protein
MRANPFFPIGALCLAAAPANARPTAAPTVRIGDTASLAALIQFGPPVLPGARRAGEVYWRVDVDLPRGASVRRISLPGYAPVFLALRDGRCFRVELNSSGNSVEPRIAPGDCPPAPGAAAPPATPLPGLSYVGTAWDIGAWRDKASGKTVLIGRRDAGRRILLTTKMRVLAVGGIGTPDAPMTEVSLVGYVGRQLTIATVILYLP